MNTTFNLIDTFDVTECEVYGKKYAKTAEGKWVRIK